LPQGSATVERTPRKVEEIVLDSNSLASLSTSEAPQIACDRRPDSALIAEFRTAQNVHFTKQSRADTSVRGESSDSSSLANRGRESSWPGIRRSAASAFLIASPSLTRIWDPALAGQFDVALRCDCSFQATGIIDHAQDEADVVWFLVCFCVKIDCCWVWSAA